MRKAILMVVLAVSLIASFSYWLIFKTDQMTIREILMIGALLLVVAFALFLAFRRLRDAKQNLPQEDEMSKSILRRGTATAFHLSLFMWLGVMYLSDKTELECHSLIGAGIMGMALLFAIGWIYHRYIRRSHD
jgi:heme/copper-type cytochrome/quinol oxidase subunit 2